MRYAVEIIYGNRNEWSDEIEFYDDALNHALAMSEILGVSEARVWDDDEIVATCVDGVWLEDEPEDEWAEYDEPHYPFDEVGYDPYTGGYDADL
jgi:ribonuclease HI